MELEGQLVTTDLTLETLSKELPLRVWESQTGQSSALLRRSHPHISYAHSEEREDSPGIGTSMAEPALPCTALVKSYRPPNSTGFQTTFAPTYVPTSARESRRKDLKRTREPCNIHESLTRNEREWADDL